jgi:hypothetical protein
MKRILSALSAVAFAASLGLVAFTPVNAADTMKSTKPMTAKEMKTDPSSAPKAKSKQWHCKSGETYIKGYTKKDGTKVKGYCRKP